MEAVGRRFATASAGATGTRSAGSASSAGTAARAPSGAAIRTSPLASPAILKKEHWWQILPLKLFRSTSDQRCLRFRRCSLRVQLFLSKQSQRVLALSKWTAPSGRASAAAAARGSVRSSAGSPSAELSTSDRGEPLLKARGSWFVSAKSDRSL